MASRCRSCKNHPDWFCYICGKFKITNERNRVTEFIQKAYYGYFCVKLDQDKKWAPHIVCKACVEHLRQWTQGSRKAVTFGIPMIWREPKNHNDDCYFCAINLTGITLNVLIFVRIKFRDSPIFLKTDFSWVLNFANRHI